MSLEDIYDVIRPTIVAICQTFESGEEHDDPPEYPHIIGTGFIVDERGLILTNLHIANLIEKLPRPAGGEEPRSKVFVMISTHSGDAYYQVSADTVCTAVLDGFVPHPSSLDKEPPDLALLQIDCTGLPVAKLTQEVKIREGRRIATSGYTMGTNALLESGFIKHVSPTLQSGIVAGVFPSPFGAPTGFSIDVMTQKGASGSPIFCVETGEILGVLHGGLKEEYTNSLADLGEELAEYEDEESSGTYFVPTSISYACPAHLIRSMLTKANEKNEWKDHSKFKSLEQRLSEPGAIDIGAEGTRGALEKIEKPKDETSSK